MASINVGNNSSNMYRVGDYVYFEVQQSGIHQPFQIRRIEELNKTANGNIEVKVMCFYRRRDLPSQLVDLADKHQQQQLLLALSLSPGESSVKDCDKKEQRQFYVDEHTNSKTELSEVTDSVKEEEKQNDVTEAMETDLVAPAAIKSAGDENDDTNDKFLDNEKTTKSTHDWWRGEQLKQRELFLSRQVETLAATHIRGKCTVTLYNETESLDSYLEREDTFFYCLVFDPVQKTLLADKGEIRVGNKYQAEIPSKALCNSGNYTDMAKDLAAVIKNECLSTSGDDPMDTEYIRDIKPKSSSTITTVESDSEFETLMWTCNPQWNSLTDRQIDQFLVVSRSLGTFARALDCTSSVKQPSLHMSAAAASRDITLFHAMDTLHRHGYDFGIATCSLVPSTGPVLCRDEMEEWSASEANLFEEALEKYGKDFGDIRHDFLPWKTHKNIVEYYYMWKTTDRYVQQKRVKAVEQENKLKHVYIPSNNGTIKNVGKQQTLTSPGMMKSAQLVNGNSSAVELYSKNSGLSTDVQLLSGVCDLCDVVASQQWYPNTIGIASISNHQQNGVVSSTLCHACWNHFKKYGGSRTATSDKKIIGHSIFGDEDHPISNASSGSAMNLNVLASSRPSAQIQTQMSTSQHHLMHLGNLHQPQINSFGSSTTTHRCTIIGCQAPSYKNKSQLLRHYSIAHGIGINSNNSTSTPIITSISGGVDGSNTISSPQPVQQQTVGLLHHSSGGPLNLNYSNNSIPHSNTVPGSVNQVINLVASSPQVQSNSLSSVATNSAIGTAAAITATGRPVMKTRTAFYLRCTSLAKASRRRAVQRAILLLQDNVTKCSNNDNSVINPILSTSVQPCLARPRNVARRPFVCVPQAAHTYKHECMLSMQNAPIHELRSYLKAASVKTHARRPGVTRVANTLIAARKGHGAAAVSDLTIPDWLFLPSQQHHHISSSSASSKQGKHSSSRLSTGRIAFPKPPKAPDGSLLYERVPNKLEAAAIGLNPTAPSITGALRQPGGPVNSNSVSGSPNDPSAPGFDVTATTAAICQQQNDTSSSGNKRRLYESDNAAEQHQPKPQAGPPSKRMHRHHVAQHQPPSIQGGNNGSSGGAVDSLLATLSSGPSQLNKSRSQMHHHYRTPSMARTGRKHVISWTDAPDDLYYRCTTLSKSLRKTRMTSKDLKRSARKPWQPISALLGISFSMPSSSSSAVPLTTGCTFGLQPSVASPFDMSITGNGCTTNNRQPLNQSTVNIVQPNVTQSLLSRTSGNTGHH